MQGPSVNCLERTIVAIGTLDLAYVVWVVSGVLRDGGFGLSWNSIVAFGLPYPAMQAAGNVAAFRCGFNVEIRYLTQALDPQGAIYAG